MRKHRHFGDLCVLRNNGKANIAALDLDHLSMSDKGRGRKWTVSHLPSLWVGDAGVSEVAALPFGVEAVSL